MTKSNAPQTPKNQKRDLLFYLCLLLLSVLTIGYISHIDTNVALASSEAASTAVSVGEAGSFETFLSFVLKHMSSTFGLLLAQIIVILFASRVVAWCFTKIGQPSVIGEILAGIILGPSLLGAFFPEAFATLFPESSLGNIQLLSQFGLIFFMFVIGLELDLSDIKARFRKTMIISSSGIVIPFIMGAIVSLFLFDQYSGSSHALLPFALFIGISMSVTAFPVLARIVQERGQMNTHIGLTALTSAASGDIIAWCMVAVIMAISQVGSGRSALFTILFAIAYMLLMFAVVRPLLKLVGKLYNNTETAGKGIIALIFLTLLLSSYLTEILGLHALFGAFITGVIMPEDIDFRRLLTNKVEDVSLSVFLPLFFVSTGLQTEIGLLNSPIHWLITLLLITIAVVGKLGGTYIGARVAGEDRKSSLYIGILMNTRGLMELVILSMGYSLGILSTTIYAMLVIMTLVTTVMTTPTIQLFSKYLEPEVPLTNPDSFRVLFSFGRPSTGLLMMRLLKTFFPQHSDQTDITALHMTVGTDTNPYQAEYFRQTNFAPLHAYAKQAHLPISEQYEVTDNPTSTIIQSASTSSCNLLLVGANLHLSDEPHDKEISRLQSKLRQRFGIGFTSPARLFSATQMLRDKTDLFISGTSCSVGIVVDRGLKHVARRILVVHDSSAPDAESYSTLVHTLTQHSSAKRIATVDLASKGNEGLRFPKLLPHDLMIISHHTWKQETLRNPEIVAHIPTTLILKSRSTEAFAFTEPEIPSLSEASTTHL